MAFYAFRVAVRSILHEKWVNLLSVLTIATGLLFIAFVFLFVSNLHIATKKLPQKFSMMLYLKDNLSKEELENIINTARKNSAVKTVRHIPKDAALRELKTTLKNTEFVLDGLEENPLPDSIEIKLKSEAIGHDTVKKLASDFKKIEAIHEIEYGEKILSSIYSVKVGMETAGVMSIIIMSAGMIFVCYSTVKLLFYRRAEEIETCKLLGATRGFIRAPFIIEGAVIGFGGGLLALGSVLSLYYLIILKFISVSPLLKAVVFPLNILLFLPVAGLLIGTIGAGIAIGRIKY
ncbi:MAG: permease-like cell division protein FtsX [Nitrospirota bacterium]